FQADDGIRDRDVTGVQTCAVPILGVLLPVNGGYKRPPPKRWSLLFFILPIRLLNPDSLPPIFSPHRSVLPLLQHRSSIHQSNHHPSPSFSSIRSLPRNLHQILHGLQ